MLHLWDLVGFDGDGTLDSLRGAALAYCTEHLGEMAMGIQLIKCFMRAGNNTQQ